MVLSADLIGQTNGGPIKRLRLRGLDEPFRNEEICVLHPIEEVEPDDIPELDLAHPGRLARFQLLMDSSRLGLAPGDDRLVSSTRSRIEFEPYQQIPALRALELPRPRLLIADDVGLGKTIEAGLILRELNARRRAARILIVCPASIIEQWQMELASKFGFQFKIFDSDGVAEARRSLEVGTNPWSAEPRVIASVDFIKRREGAFRELSASRWDVILCAATAEPRPSHARAAKGKSCSCAAASTNGCETPSITGPGAVRFSILKQETLRRHACLRTLARPDFAWHRLIAGSKSSPQCSRPKPSTIPSAVPLNKVAPRPPDRRPSPYCLTVDKG